MSANLMAATSLVPTLLTSSQPASGEHTVYTVPASTSVKVAHGTLCNISTSTITVSLSLVPSGGTVDGTHRVISGYSLASGETLPLTSFIGGALLGPGDYISVNSSANTALCVVISGAVSS